MESELKNKFNVSNYNDAIQFILDYGYDAIPDEWKTKFLKLANNQRLHGWTVAHELAWAGYKFDDPEILKLADNYYGITVAHMMAQNDYKFDDPEILKLTTYDGLTVAHKMGVGKN